MTNGQNNIHSYFITNRDGPLESGRDYDRHTAIKTLKLILSRDYKTEK